VADRQPPSLTWRWVAAITAFLLAVAGVAFLVVSVQQHRDAQDDLTRARDQLAAARTNSSLEARRLTAAQRRARSVGDQLTALGKGVSDLGDMDQRDLDAVKAAIQAGLGGDLSGYNAAVDSRRALDPQHDAAVEQLREQANAVISALNDLR
jgi:hypothetical protein